MTVERFLPVIDYCQSDKELADQLFEAFTSVGFACVTSTGIWEKAKDFTAKAKREFFTLPVETKRKYAKRYNDIDAGWITLGAEQATKDRPADYKESFNMYVDMKGDRKRAPEVFDKEQYWELWDNCTEVCDRINYLLGIALKLKDPYTIANTHNFSEAKINKTSIRVNWYPEQHNEPASEDQLRCGEHTDFGGITILYCDSPGLQVLDAKTKEFKDADLVPGGVFLNIGDLLQMWSGDKLPATVHRVLNPANKTDERLSLAFFGSPDDDTVIETLDGSGKYPPVTSGAWLTKKFEELY